MSHNGYILAGDGDPRHGTANGYGNLMCRCPDCTTAWADDARKRRNRPRSLPPDDPRHGTPNAYTWWHCHCDACVDGKRAADAASARRRRRKLAERAWL